MISNSAVKYTISSQGKRHNNEQSERTGLGVGCRKEADSFQSPEQLWWGLSPLFHLHGRPSIQLIALTFPLIGRLLCNFPRV